MLQIAIGSAYNYRCCRTHLPCSAETTRSINFSTQPLKHYPLLSMQGKGCHTLDDSDANTLYDRPDVDTLLRLHDYQAMPEVFCCDYRLLRRPPVEVVKEKLPGEIYSPNLGLTVPTGRSGRWRTRKAKPPPAELLQKHLLTELAESQAAQEVQQHAATTDWLDIADLLHQELTNASVFDQQQPYVLTQAYVNSTVNRGAMCSTKRAHYLHAFDAAATSKQHSHDKTVHDSRSQPCYTDLQQHDSGASGMQLSASSATYSDAAAHPDTAMDSNMTTDHNSKTHSTTAKRKRNQEVSTEQFGVDEEDDRDIQPKTPEQGDQARERAMFRRMEHSNSEGTSFARPQVGDIVWAKVLNHPFWPAQVTEPADKHKVVLREQYGSLTDTGIHVTFFGDNGSVGYARPDDVKAFCWENEDAAKPGKTKCAVREAKTAQVAQVQLAQKYKRRRQQ